LKNLIRKWKAIKSSDFIVVTLAPYYRAKIPNKFPLFRLSAFLHPFFKKFNSKGGLIFNIIFLALSCAIDYHVYQTVLVILMIILLISMISFIYFQTIVNKWLKEIDDDRNDGDDDEPEDWPVSPPSIMLKFIEESKNLTPV
jgi:hypothetical protein